MRGQRFLLVRPIRAATFVFAGLVTLCAVAAPFVEEVNAAELILFGVAYSLLLATFSIGFALAMPSRAVLWWSLSSALLPLGTATVWLFWLTWTDADTAFRALPIVTYCLLAAVWAYLGAGLLIAGWGWVRYIRYRRAA
jgi:hypothetical protein